MTNCWVTVNRAGMLDTWDLSTLTSTPWLKVLDSNLSLVNDSAELHRIKLYSVGTSDRKIYILDPLKRQVYKTISLPTEGINKMKYMACFSVLVVAGFSRNIPIFELDIRHREFSRKGELQGHASNIAVLEAVENSPTVITVDDVPSVKVWDVRTFKCIQTLNFKIGTTIINMVAIPEHQKLGLVSTRVNVIELHPFYGEKYSNLLDPMNRELILSDVVFDYKRKLFVVFSNRGILEVSALTGATNRIITNVFNPEEQDDLGRCDYDVDQSIAIASNVNGNFIFQDVILNEGILTVEGNKKEVLSFYMDKESHLMLMAGYDNSIKIYHEPQRFDFSKREKLKSTIVSDSQVLPKSIIAGIEQHSTHKFFDYSLTYDMMVSVFPTKLIFFSIDTYRLMLILNFPQASEITSFKLFREKGIIVVGLSSEDVVIMKVTKRSYNKIEVKQVASLNLKKYYKLAFKEVNRLRLVKLSIGHLLKNLGLIYTDVKTSLLAEPINISGLTPLFTEFLWTDGDLELLVGTVQGIFIKLNRSSFLKQRLDSFVEKKGDILVKNNFNFGKRLLINYAEQLKYSVYDNINIESWLLENQIQDFKVDKVNHCRLKDPRCMKIVVIGGIPYIISVLNPCYFLVLSTNLSPLCKLNINHPLPLYWDLQAPKEREVTNKLSEIGKFFTHMLIHYEQSFLVGEEQRKERYLAGIVRQLVQQEELLDIDQVSNILEEVQDIENKVGKPHIALMKDSYHPKDMVYKRIRKENLQEVAGPNLYQMERRRKFTKDVDKEVKISDNPHLKFLMLDNFEEKVKADIEGRFSEADKTESHIKRRLSNEFRKTDNFFRGAEKLNMVKTPLLKKTKKGSLSSTSKTGQNFQSSSSPRKTSHAHNRRSQQPSSNDSGLLVINEGENERDDGKYYLNDIFRTNKERKEILSPMSISHSREMTITNFLKPEQSLQQTHQLLPVDSKTISVNQSFEQKEKPKKRGHVSTFFIKNAGPSSKSMHKSRESGFSIQLQQPGGYSGDSKSVQTSLKKLTDVSMSNALPPKHDFQATISKLQGFKKGNKLMTTSSNWLNTGQIPAVKPEYGDKLENFLRETNFKMFRSTSGDFEIRKRDCSIASKDKNLATFVKSIDLKKKKAKHGIK